jgi:hypothetical protein
MKTDDLLPCPFCNGKFIPEHPKMRGCMPFTSEPKLEQLTEYRGYRVSCYGCGVGTWDGMRYTKEEAVSAWNTRYPYEN